MLNYDQRPQAQSPQANTQANTGRRDSLASMSYAEGAAALSPEREGDAATDRRRANRHIDPRMMSADRRNAAVGNMAWANRGQLYVNGISATDVHQTNINDCYFVAVLSSIANENPNYIRSIIRENAPGNYSVRFFEKVPGTTNYQQVWINVDGFLPTRTRADGTDQIHYGHSNDTTTDSTGQSRRELWPSIMEKAYAKFKGNYSDIDWGNTTYAYEALFGTQGTRTNTGNTAAQQNRIWNRVKSALDNNRPLVCSTGSHVVTPLSYSGTGANRKIRVRDQAATRDGSRTGETEYTLATFCTTFTYIRDSDVNAYARSGEGIHLAGDWTTNYGDMHLESTSGDQFQGTYGGSSPGRIPYAFQGSDSMFGRWIGNDGREGRFQFQLQSDRRSFTGTWGSNMSNSDGGRWTGRRS